MKATLHNVYFTISIIGNAGYRNNSNLELFFNKLGFSIKLGDEWDLSLIKNILIRDISRIELRIPSGMLKMKTINFIEINNEDELIINSSFSTWNGKQAGLLGGMSGYGIFRFKKAEVNYGVYTKWYDNIDLSEYNSLIARSRELYNYNPQLYQYITEDYSSDIKIENEHNFLNKTIFNIEGDVANNILDKHKWSKWLDYLKTEEAQNLYKEIINKKEQEWEAKREKFNKRVEDCEDYDDNLVYGEYTDTLEDYDDDLEG